MRALRLFHSPRLRAVAHVAFAAGGLAMAFVIARHLAAHGWPFAGASIPGVVAAGVLFLAAFAFKAWGWQQLFSDEARPTAVSLAAAGGAASVTGVALPGRCDSLVRVTVVRRFSGQDCGLSRVLISLFTLGLVDNAALVPFAAVAAAVAAPNGLARIAFVGVAAAGLIAAIGVVVLPRVSGMRRVVRFRAGRWAAAHAAPPRKAAKAWLLVLVSWTLRGTALLVLLDALALGGSISHALVFLCASAAATALPITPHGAAAQAGAGAAVLGAAGISTSHAIGFAIAAQALGMLAGATILVLALVVHFSRRVRGAGAVAAA